IGRPYAREAEMRINGDRHLDHDGSLKSSNGRGMPESHRIPTVFWRCIELFPWRGERLPQLREATLRLADDSGWDRGATLNDGALCVTLTPESFTGTESATLP